MGRRKRKGHIPAFHVSKNNVYFKKKRPARYDLAISGGFFHRALGFIFPPKCIFCGKIMPPNVDIYICGDCFGLIPFAEETVLRQPAKERMRDGCDEIICICRYEGIIKDSLIRCKFYNKPSYCRTFGRLMAEKTKKVLDAQRFDMIAAIPLHKDRENERGYNQSFLISRELSRRTGIPEMSRLISRVKRTDSQSLLAKSERLRNIKDAFRVNDGGKIKGKSVILIDDIMTTGATLDECGRVLKEAGAGKVAGAVLASGRMMFEE